MKQSKPEAQFPVNDIRCVLLLKDLIITSLQLLLDLTNFDLSETCSSCFKELCSAIEAWEEKQEARNEQG